ncbi:MAG: dephospho-CoA kinase [Gammaproteobacteria bacterium]|nr:MAG: dephospho-CoA kinase [Gammaproteobacteria bacterium]
MLVIGLTGGIGCGKSLVSDLFHDLYTIPIIDADIIARELSQTTPVIELISQQLGADYLDENKQLLRVKLRKAIFSDPDIRTTLENILHPLVYDDISKQLSEIKANYCIVVIPLLLETKRTDILDRILVVDCTIEEQILRVTKRDQCSELHVKNIIATQIDRDSRLSLADDIIENSESISLVKEKIALLHKKYTELSIPHNKL